MTSAGVIAGEPRERFEGRRRLVESGLDGFGDDRLPLPVGRTAGWRSRWRVGGLDETAEVARDALMVPRRR